MSAKPSWKREHVRVGRLVEAAMHAVQNGVRGLMRDDVVRQTGIDAAAGHVVARVVGRHLEVAEQQSHILRAVEGVGLPQCMRVDSPAVCTKLLSSSRSSGCGLGRQRTGRPSALSKCSMVFIATA